VPPLEGVGTEFIVISEIFHSGLKAETREMGIFKSIVHIVPIASVAAVVTASGEREPISLGLELILNLTQEGHGRLPSPIKIKNLSWFSFLVVCWIPVTGETRLAGMFQTTSREVECRDPGPFLSRSTSPLCQPPFNPCFKVTLRVLSANLCA